MRLTMSPRWSRSPNQETYDLASFMVKLHCQQFGREALDSGIRIFLLHAVSASRGFVIRSARSPGPPAAACWCGRKPSPKAGGISAIRDQIIDDCALARAIKRSGGRVWLGVTPRHVQHARLRLVRGDRAHDCPHRLQPAAAFRGVPGRCHRRNGDRVSCFRSVRCWRADTSGWSRGRAMLGAHGRRLPPMVRFYGLRGRGRLRFP